MGMLARMIRGTNENPGDFVIEILNTEKLAGEGEFSSELYSSVIRMIR